MAEQSKPGQGVIVRADFGGGIDQSMDAWRVPPTQLADLVNGRLERVGSVRKRNGYVGVTPPPAGSPNAGDPVAAIASTLQTVVVDRARDAAIDSTNGVIIAPEAGYVARQYAPATTDDWQTRGAVSDVIGDVVTWDAEAGDFDEAFDMGADEDFVFVAKITRGQKLYGATGPTVTWTVSMYDATTKALIARERRTVTGGVYPKLCVFPTLNTIVISYATPNTRVGIATTTVAATVNMEIATYGATGFGAFTTIPIAGCANDCDWSDLAAFHQTSAERYRPLVPYDVIAFTPSVLLLAVYSTRTGNVRLNRYTVTAGTATFGLTADVTKTGALPIVTLALCPYTATEFGLSSVGADVQMALSPPWQSAAARHQLWIVDGTLTTVATNAFAIPLVTGPTLPLISCGSVHCAITGDAPARLTSYAEIMQWDATTGDVWAHYLDRVTIDGATGALVDDQHLSSAVPTARPFELTYYGTIFVNGRLPVRMPLALGVSQQAWLGRFAATDQLLTDVAANYSSNIGTAIITGPLERTTTCVNSPAQTVAPRLMPTTGPKPFTLIDQRHVPHRPAIDAAGGFGFASIALSRRTPGDVRHERVGGTATSAGGLVQTLDGTASAETAIVDRPRLAGVRQHGGGARVDFAAGDYLLSAVFVYRDAGGNVHRSAPSDPYRLTVASIQDTWDLHYSVATYLNRDDVSLEVYVTEPNGTVLRRWYVLPGSPQPGAAVAGFRQVRVHDVSVGVNRANGLPDLDAPTIYTTGGALPFVPVASARSLALFRNRLIVAGADDARNVYYTNEPEAFEAPSFAVGNVIRLEHEGGCTAVGALGDKLILFSSSGVYAVFGQFRDRFGAGSAITPPEAVHDSIGCTQPVSVTPIPTGLLFFANDDRWYLLSDRMELVPIGLRVQEYTTTEQGAAGQNKCDAVVHIDAESEVRMFMRNPLTNARQVLVYNYQVDQWSRDVIYQYAGANTWGGACMSPSLGAFVATSTAWTREDRTVWLDDGTQWVTLTARTAWIQPGGSQDYARVRYCQFLGRSAAAHNLTITVHTDFDAATVKATGTWTAAQLAPIAGTSWPAQVKLQVGSQKTQATQIVIADAAPTGATTGQGPQLVGLALEVLPLGGVKRLPNARKR